MECINSMFSDVNLWNNLGFSLYAVLSVCHMVITLDNWMKSGMRVSADLVCCYWTPEIEFNKNYLYQLLD